MKFDNHLEIGPEHQLHGLLLPKIERNDPSITTVGAYWRDENPYMHNENWEEKGVYLGRNTHMKTFKLEVLDTSYTREGDNRHFGWRISGHPPANLEAFCRGLAQNRSIERLFIRGCDPMDIVLPILAPFIEQAPNLREIVMDCCELKTYAARSLTSALDNRINKDSLIRLDIMQSCMNDDDGQELMLALKKYPHIVRLGLGGNRLSSSACNVLAAFLQEPNSHSLRDLHLENNELNDHCMGVMSNALNRNTTVKKLSLNQNDGSITCYGWQLLARRVLSGPNSTLEVLTAETGGIDSESAGELSRALSTNTKLKSIDLMYNEAVCADGWSYFFNIFANHAPYSGLSEVSLSENNIDDDVAEDLATSLANLSSLKVLKLDDNKDIQERGWHHIANLLQCHRNSLVEIDLSLNRIPTKNAVEIAGALLGSSSLESFNFNFNGTTRAEGWFALASCFQNCPRMETLNIGINSGINAAAGIQLAKAFSNMRNLKFLKFYGLDFSADAWRQVLRIMGNSRQLALEHLDISCSRFHDTEATILAHGLATTKNTSLKVLKMDTHSGRSTTGITRVGGESYLKLVCDKSSIESTYSSNHTLYQINEDYEWDENRVLSGDALHALSLNMNPNKKEVIRHKIIWSHFQSGNMNIQAFLDMDFNVLPHAMAWGGKDSLGQSLLFTLIRGMPLLVEHANKKPMAKSISGKRMRSDELQLLQPSSRPFRPLFNQP